MGLFDKFSKKKDAENEAAENETENVTEKAAEEIAEEKTEETAESVSSEKSEQEESSETDGKEENAEAENKSASAEEAPKMNNVPTRFTLLVENVFEVDENESIAAVGNLHGRIYKGDKFYIIHPKFPQGIEAEADTLVVDKETPSFAQDCRVAIKITSITNPDDIPKYAVLSNVAPQVQTDPSKPLENPFLVGLSTEYNRLVQDNDFTYLFMIALLTSRYVTPADMDLAEPNAEGKALVKDSKIRFRLLRHPNAEKQLALPVFTDMSALRLWKGALEPGENGERPKTLLMPFERCADIGMKNDGLVVNPFGPVAVFVSKQNIVNTLSLGKQAVERQKAIEAQKNAAQKSDN